MEIANDVVMLSAVVLFFAAALAYTALCERWV